MSVKRKTHAHTIENWEMELATKIARTYPYFPQWSDLEAELFCKLASLKSKKRKEIKDWKGFLAKSLLNFARDYIRRCKFGQHLFQSIEDLNQNEEFSLEDTIPHPGDSPESGIDVKLAFESLSPDLQQLWLLLMEESGNQVRVAARLGKPRTTVKYWIDILKRSLTKRGFIGEKK